MPGSLITPAGGSVHSTHTDVLMANYTSGMQLHGRMSAVRRFFCLVVTFDLCFTALFWIICVLVDGANIIDALKFQVLQYNIKTSIFDIVLCAFCRFSFLILFYAIIHINHWWLVAIVTTLNCVFLIAKAMLYQWSNDSNSTSHPFEVMLILFSFFIAWAEAWFIDFRVLPQEARARSIWEVTLGGDDRFDTSRVPTSLERVRDYLSQYTESVGNFYSPLESPADSDEENSCKIPKRLTVQEAEYVLRADEALKVSLDTINSTGWTQEKIISHTDVIFSKKGPKGYKIFKLMAVVEASAESLFKECLHNFESIPDWNKAIVKSKLIQVVNSKVDITYQISSETPGGVVAQRDFVGVRQWGNILNGWVIGGVSIVHPDVPVCKNMVRAENGPNCIVFKSIDDHPDKCGLQWLLDVDIKGWIPKYVLEQALVGAITEFLASVRNYAPVLRNKNRTPHQERPVPV